MILMWAMRIIPKMNGIQHFPFHWIWNLKASMWLNFL